MTPPTLHTARLILRPMRLDDFEAYAAELATPQTRFMGGPFSRAGAWAMFCHDVACWPLFGHGALMLERGDTGACVGQVGINAGPLYPETELGWLTYAAHRRQGFAAEGAAALRDWARHERGLSTLVSYIDRDNAPSIAVARSLGAREDRNAPRQDPEDVVYRHFP